jgi:signal transduction histidine kinase
MLKSDTIHGDSRPAGLQRLHGDLPPGSFLLRMTAFRLMLGLWAVAAALDLAISMAGGGTAATFARVGFTYVCGFVISLAYYPIVGASVGRVSDISLLRLLMVTIPSGAILFVIDVFGRAFAHGHSPFQTWPAIFFERSRLNWTHLTILFLFQSIVIWLVGSAQALEQRESQLLKARLANLRLQLNPHFLFNTLTAISTLVKEENTKEADAMIMRLSDFLRMSLNHDQTVLVPLATEIELVQAYLDVESVRFGDRLAVSYNFDPGLSDLSVPNFILQPLVENAVKYAVAPSKKTVTLLIAATTRPGHLILRVQDSGHGSTFPSMASGTGVGLANVTARLEALYGEDGRLETHHDEAGFIATIYIPVALKRN